VASTGLSGARALGAPARALPVEPWRLWLALAGLAGVVLTASGLAANELFAQPTMTKQLATLAAPLLLLGCALVREPLRAPMAVVIIGMPFVTYSASFGNVSGSALVLPLLLAVVLASIAPARIRLITPRTLVVLALLAIPVGLASDVAEQIQLIGLVALTVWLVRRTAEADTGLRFVIATLVLCCAVQAALGVWQSQTGQRFSLLTGSTSTFGSDYFFSFGEVNRPTAAFFDPISFGNVLAFGLPLAAALALATRSHLIRLAAIGSAGLMATALILTLSRMSWVGAAAGLVVTIAVLPGRMRLTGLLGTAAVVAATLSVAVGMEGTDIVERAQSLGDPTSTSVRTGDTDRARVRIWQAAVDVFETNPVSGVGLGDLGDELVGRVGFGSGPGGHAHSVYLQTIATAGVLGALALLLLAWEVARRTIVTLRAPMLGALDRERRIVAAGIAGSLAALAVVCATDTTPRYLQVAGIVAIVLGCALSLGRRTHPT
jgi:O-antigen ligase